MRTLPLLAAAGAILLTLHLAPTRAAAPDDAERQAIRAVALDYVDGWYTGDVERMERALHPDLAKRTFRTDDETGKTTMNHMTAAELISKVRAGGGTDTPPDVQRRDVKILDVYGNTASVRADMHAWIDYMHLAKVDGKWKIINVLWELTPEAYEQRRERRQRDR